VPPSACLALAHGGLDGVFSQSGEDVIVAGGIKVKGAVEAYESMVPSLVTLVAFVVRFEHRADGFAGWLPWAVFAAHPLFDDCAVLGFARGYERHGLDDATFATARFFRIGDESFFQGLPRLFENSFCFRALIRSGVRIIRKGAEFQFHVESDGIDGKFFQIHISYLFLSGFLRFPIIQ
jgi:hypothetical protein